MDIRSSLSPQETNNTSKMVPSPRFINFIALRRSDSNERRRWRKHAVIPCCQCLKLNKQKPLCVFGNALAFLCLFDNCQHFGTALILYNGCFTCGSRIANVMEILARKRSGIIQTWVFCLRATQWDYSPLIIAYYK